MYMLIRKAILPLFIFLPLWSYSQNALINVVSMVDTAEIFIGDRVTYSIIVERDKNLRIEKPGEGLNLGMFEIKEYNFSEPLEKDNIITERYDFTISVFDTGKFTIPPFPIAYFPDSSSQYKIIEASAIDIYVKSLLSGEEAPELKDIKPPIDFPFDFMFLYAMIAIVLMIALAAFLGYRAWKAKKEKGYVFIPPPTPRPAHEIALEELQKLFASDILEKKQYKIFYSRLSEILRGYLEGRYFISALEETTWEIIQDLQKHVDEKQNLSLRNILEESDLVKFAKHLPKDNDIENVKKESEQFIHDTKLVFKEESDNKDSNETQTEIFELEESNTK